MTARPINPERYIVPGGTVVLLPASACRFLVGYVNLIEMHSRYRGMNPEIDAVVQAIRAVDLHAQRSANGTQVAAEPEQPARSQWYSTGQAAERIGVTDRAVRKWCSDGTIPATRIAGRWRITSHDVAAKRAAVRPRTGVRP